MTYPGTFRVGKSSLLSDPSHCTTHAMSSNTPCHSFFSLQPLTTHIRNLFSLFVTLLTLSNPGGGKVTLAEWYEDSEDPAKEWCPFILVILVGAVWYCADGNSWEHTLLAEVWRIHNCCFLPLSYSLVNASSLPFSCPDECLILSFSWPGECCQPASLLHSHFPESLQSHIYHFLCQLWDDLFKFFLYQLLTWLHQLILRSCCCIALSLAANSAGWILRWSGIAEFCLRKTVFVELGCISSWTLSLLGEGLDWRVIGPVPWYRAE